MQWRIVTEMASYWCDHINEWFIYFVSVLINCWETPHHLPVAADWWCCVFMSCLYPDNNLISWRSVELLLMSYFTDWHSCFRAVGPVSVFILVMYIYHYAIWSIFLPDLYTLHCCTTKTNYQFSWRRPYRLWPKLVVALTWFIKCCPLKPNSKISACTESKTPNWLYAFSFIHFT